jgi:hypothetical protein
VIGPGPGALVLAAGCPVLAPAPGAAGDTAVSPVPAADAIAFNNAGKTLYRQRDWSGARAKYRAALEADPEFLAPALNAACALAREERFAEAAREAAALIRRAYVPWGREVMEAADLAVLHVRSEMRDIRTALTEAGPAWGQSLLDGLFFVARTRPAVALEGQGVLVLSLHQELHAWLPGSGRYRQVTSEDGRVLAAVRSEDGRTVVYVRAGKLLRSPGAPPALRALTVRRLEVPTMTLGPPLVLAGDVEEVALWPVRAGAELRVRRAGAAPEILRLAGGDVLLPRPALSAEAQLGRPVRLTARGVTELAQVAGPARCAYRAGDERPANGAARVRVQAGKKSVVLAAPLGAGLFGLPFPGQK